MLLVTRTIACPHDTYRYITRLRCFNILLYADATTAKFKISKNSTAHASPQFPRISENAPLREKMPIQSNYRSLPLTSAEVLASRSIVSRLAAALERAKRILAERVQSTYHLVRLTFVPVYGTYTMHLLA